MFSRPKRGESEDDLLKQQEEFFKNKNSTPAASIIKRKSQNENECSTSDNCENIRKKHRSKFAASKGEKSSSSDGKSKKDLTVGPDVLGDIQEKNMLNAVILPPCAVAKQGFPEVFVRDKSLVPTGKSIFAQQAAKLKDVECMDTSVDAADTNGRIDISDAEKRFGDKSYVLTGEDSQKIHEENVEKLSSMTVETILEEQKKLMAQLDPTLLKFLRSKRQINNDDENGKQDSTNSPKLTQSSKKCEMETDVNNDVRSSVLDDLSHSSVTYSEDAEMKIENPVEENNVVNLEELDLPIKSEEANKWLHMDVVERDKLKWIGDLPSPPSLPANTPYSARFDFQGILLPYSDEVDVTKALHHHGEEPERPGYTLQELLQLSRSSNLQQRVVALKTLSNILDKTKAGYYDECLDTPLLNQLAESDLYLLLRFSLDDCTETMVTATLLAVRNLLWNEADEVCLDRLLGLWNGHMQPSLMAKNEIKKQSEKEELKEDEVELKDHQILRLDMIKGALRTDLMLRLRYILEVLKPGPRAVISVLEILTRIVRHSHDAALAVTCCPRLLSFIITNFVPRDWRGIVGSSRPSEMNSVYGIPLVEALKLLRVIASCSRSMASDLVHKLGVMESIIGYISIDPRECGLPQKEAVRLSLESLYFWNTLLSYNFASIQFIDMYPVLMRLLQFHLTATSTSDPSSTFGHEHGAALMSLITQAMLIADAQTKMLASQKVNVSPQRIAVTVTYDHLSGFVQPISLCLKKWLNQLVRTEEITFTALKLVAATLNCAAVWINKFHSEPDVDSVSLMEELENLVNSAVQPFLSSSNFKLLCGRMKSSSCLLADIQSGRDRDPSSLPSLGSLVWGGREVMPSISANSPFVLLQGLAHFLGSVCSVHRGLFTQSVRDLLDNPTILEYVTQLGSKKLHAGNNWFTRIETTMLAHVLKLVSVILPSSNYEHIAIFHSMAIRLVAVIPSDEKHLAKEIFCQVIFNPDFFRDCSDVTYSLEALKLTDVTQEQDKASICSLLEAATDKIPSLWPCYESALNLVTVKDHSPLDIITNTASENGLEPAFPNDWSYLPILKLYGQAFSGKESIEDNTKSIVSSLQWLLIVECLRPQSTAIFSVTARFCRLCTVFLAGNDLFLLPEVHNYLEALLRILLRRNSLLNFNEKIPGLSSFYDLYTQLVEQFVGVSYGDELFGHFVLIPLQQRHSSSFRKLLWSEHAAALRVLRTKPEQLAVPLQDFLEPCETEPSLLMCYFSGIMSGQVREMWCPVLYQVALHHVPAFILEHPETTIAQQLKSRIQQLKDKIPVQWRIKIGEIESQEKT